MAFFLIAFLFLEISSQSNPFRNASLPLEQRIDDLIGRLNVSEKIAQMMDQTPAIDRLGIPKYDWWNEALHGVARAGKATVFPQTIGMAATFDDQALYESFTIISDEARAKYHQFQRNREYDRYKGLTFWTPNINIFRDPRWGRGQETYGEDPYLTSRMGLSVVKGLQGDDKNYFKVHACAKHYAVHSGPEWSRHTYNAVVSARDLYTTYLPAFEALVTEGNVQEVMCAYNRFAGSPCCGSSELLKDILRNKWNYQGLVTSDCGAIDDFYQTHHTHSNAENASVDAVLKGTDVECGSAYKALANAINDRSITEAQLDVSLRRLLKGRFQLGMFDQDDSLIPWATLPYSIVESAEHVAKSLEMARKSIVLLKNGGNTLPLDKTSLRRVVVVGPNANDEEMLWGNYNGQPSSTVTILAGIRNKLNGTGANVTFIKGCNLYGTSYTDENNRSATVNVTATANRVSQANPDVIIYVGGISPKLEGEEMSVTVDGFRGGDRTNVDIPPIQRQMVTALKGVGVPIVYVSCSGSAIAYTYENENMDALLQAWYGGEQAGTAVADVLFGDYVPAGRLPVTFYNTSSSLPDFEDYAMKGRTYRYTNQNILFPFGYGLSYTTFAYANAKLSATSITRTQSVNLSVDVTNSGRWAGDEVVQVYVSYPNNTNEPLKQLKAFKRVNIPIGQTVTVTFTLPPSTFNTFDETAQGLTVRAGTYTLSYGGSSSDKDLSGQSLQITVQ